jgi:hypothetical protein
MWLESILDFYFPLYKKLSFGKKSHKVCKVEGMYFKNGHRLVLTARVVLHSCTD